MKKVVAFSAFLVAMLTLVARAERVDPPQDQDQLFITLFTEDGTINPYPKVAVDAYSHGAHLNVYGPGHPIGDQFNIPSRPYCLVQEPDGDVVYSGVSLPPAEQLIRIGGGKDKEADQAAPAQPYPNPYPNPYANPYMPYSPYPMYPYYPNPYQPNPYQPYPQPQPQPQPQPDPVGPPVVDPFPPNPQPPMPYPMLPPQVAPWFALASMIASTIFSIRYARKQSR